MQNIAEWIMIMTALILGITVHEWAHAITADQIGDDTPRRQGRVTLWPLAHLDPMGTILMVVSSLSGIGFGWGKPVITYPGNYKINPRLGNILVSAAGPFSNLVIAILCAVVLRLGILGSDQALTTWLLLATLVNLTLFAFNLIPLYPLDGSHILLSLLPPQVSERIRPAFLQITGILFLVLALSGALSILISPVRGTLFALLLGA